MNSILMESNSPTQQRIETATVREVILDTEICDKDGYGHSCTLCYHILEEDKLITECTVIFHYGFSNDTLESIQESVKIMVEELEGTVDYATTILIQ